MSLSPNLARHTIGWYLFLNFWNYLCLPHIPPINQKRINLLRSLLFHWVSFNMTCVRFFLLTDNLHYQFLFIFVFGQNVKILYFTPHLATASTTNLQHTQKFSFQDLFKVLRKIKWNYSLPFKGLKCSLLTMHHFIWLLPFVVIILGSDFSWISSGVLSRKMRTPHFLVTNIQCDQIVVNSCEIGQQNCFGSWVD